MNTEKHIILAINPGSTSTKVAVFEGNRQTAQRTIRHAPAEFAGCAGILDQRAIRARLVERFLDEEGISLSSLSAVVGRGGLLRPIASGTYRVNDTMLADLKKGAAGRHASSLGAVIAYEISRSANVPAFIVDPVVVDELEPEARLSGIPGLPRRSVFHALNQKAIARQAAGDLGRPYEELNLLVVHMGGGISTGAHHNGRVVDMINALDGEGTFSPERCGGVPLSGIIEMCFSGEHTRDEIIAYTNKQGGMMAYLGTTDMIKAEEKAKTDPEADLVLNAMALQVAKDIGAMATVLDGKVDAVVLTGGLAYSQRFAADISRRVGFIAKILVYPGEDEMVALAQGALRVLTGEAEPLEY